MKRIEATRLLSIILVFVTTAWISGCGKPAGTTADGRGATESGHDSGEAAHSEHDGHDHGGGAHAHTGWWCDEHGIPEAECSMCSSKVAADFQQNDDWCQEHDRADSQCFICHPEAKEKYAAKYRAKYGKEPPALNDAT